MRLSRLHPATLRAAWWTVRALSGTRRTMRREGIKGAKVSLPPPLPDEAVRGVHAVLRRRPNSCLERSLILQRWHAVHGRPVDVIIGVSPGESQEDFGAHAWLDGEPDGVIGQFHEVSRLPPP